MKKTHSVVVIGLIPVGLEYEKVITQKPQSNFIFKFQAERGEYRIGDRLLVTVDSDAPRDATDTAEPAPVPCRAESDGQ